MRWLQITLPTLPILLIGPVNDRIEGGKCPSSFMKPRTRFQPGRVEEARLAPPYVELCISSQNFGTDRKVDALLAN
jgi:hypothetical protein